MVTSEKERKKKVFMYSSPFFSCLRFFLLQFVHDVTYAFVIMTELMCRKSNTTWYFNYVCLSIHSTVKMDYTTERMWKN